MPSFLYECINDAETIDTSSDSVTKLMSSADMIMAFPSPTNICRSRHLLVDVPIKLTMSTTMEMPSQIWDVVKTTDNFCISGYPQHLYGLYIDGRGYPAEIYLHRHKMMMNDPSGRKFDDTCWHECIHALEGVYQDKDGAFKREAPWSYQYEAKLKRMDQLTGVVVKPETFEPFDVAERMRYLRDGLDLQGNMSELFARVGVLVLRHIRDNGVMPQTDQDIYEMVDGFGLFTGSDELYHEIDIPERAYWKMEEIDIAYTCALHGETAIRSIYETFPEMIYHAARLYGCDMPSLKAIASQRYTQLIAEPG